MDPKDLPENLKNAFNTLTKAANWELQTGMKLEEQLYEIIEEEDASYLKTLESTGKKSIEKLDQVVLDFMPKGADESPSEAVVVALEVIRFYETSATLLEHAEMVMTIGTNQKDPGGTDLH